MQLEMRRRASRRRSRGFTLLEIAIVMAILAIVVSGVLNNFTGVSLQARQFNLVREILSIRSILDSYDSQNPIQADSAVTDVSAPVIASGSLPMAQIHAGVIVDPFFNAVSVIQTGTNPWSNGGGMVAITLQGVANGVCTRLVGQVLQESNSNLIAVGVNGNTYTIAGAGGLGAQVNQGAWQSQLMCNGQGQSMGALKENVIYLYYTP